MKLTINLATRGRPRHLAWTLTHTLCNISHKDTLVLLSVDDDDADTIAMAGQFESERVVLSIEPREDSVGEKYNRALKHPADVYLPMVDYVAHITPGFDERILEAASLFPDGIGVVYNHMANLSFPAIQAVTQGWVDHLGYIFPEYFPYWFIDHWVDDVVRMIDRVSFADVQVATQQEGRSTHEYREAYFWATFFDACGLLRRGQAREIIDAPDFLEPAWRKEVLRRNYPMIEHRSQWINGRVRELEGARLCPPGGGDRYERIKGRALTMLQERLVPSLQADYQQHEEALA